MSQDGPESPRWPVDPELQTAPISTGTPPGRGSGPSGPGEQPGRQRPPWYVVLLVALLSVVGLVVVLALVLGKVVGLADLNPFDERDTDRSQPVLLKSVRELSRFEAAEGSFQVVVDSQQDRDNIPDFLLNQRTLFVAAGSVQATVDFAALGKGAVKVVDDDTVEVRLPAPELQRPSLDVDRSYTYSEQRGLVNRLGDLLGSGSGDDQQQLYSLAQSKIAAAATEADLGERAEDSTTKLLDGLFGSLGYDDVRVTFEGGADDR